MFGFKSRADREAEAAAYLRQARYWDGVARVHAQNAQDGGRRYVGVGAVSYLPEVSRDEAERAARELRRKARRLSRRG